MRYETDTNSARGGIESFDARRASAGPAPQEPSGKKETGRSPSDELLLKYSEARQREIQETIVLGPVTIDLANPNFSKLLQPPSSITRSPELVPAYSISGAGAKAGNK